MFGSIENVRWPLWLCYSVLRTRANWVSGESSLLERAMHSCTYILTLKRMKCNYKTAYFKCLIAALVECIRSEDEVTIRNVSKASTVWFFWFTCLLLSLFVSEALCTKKSTLCHLSFSPRNSIKRSVLLQHLAVICSFSSNFCALGRSIKKLRSESLKPHARRCYFSIKPSGESDSPFLCVCVQYVGFGNAHRLDHLREEDALVEFRTRGCILFL